MSLPIAVNIDGGEGGRIAQSAEQKELDFGERGRYLIDTLSKRRDGISSSYPDLLDPSFGSCLRGGILERRQKEWWGIFLKIKKFLYFYNMLIINAISGDT